MNKGKLIVLDGTDGSGKTVQTKMLIDELESLGYDVALADFPQYGKKSSGLVEEYLNGKYGGANQVGPYRASIFYACDRYDASFKIKEWLKKGKIVIANRYVTANMGHQGGKISDPVERKNYFNWLYNLEFEIFDIPKPDLNIILHVDAEISQKLLEGKGERAYLNGAKTDIHENDLSHLRQAEEVYLEIANTFPNFKLIECVRGNSIMPREEIHALIWDKIKGLLNVNYFSPIWDERFCPTPDNLPIERTKESSSSKVITLSSTDYYSLLSGESALISTGVKLSLTEGQIGYISGEHEITANNVHVATSVVSCMNQDEIKVSVVNHGGDIFNISPGQVIAKILLMN